MNQRLEFLWIDDEEQREISSDNFSKKTQSTVNFYNVSDKDLASKIGEFMEKHTPDLVFIDHRLDKTVGSWHDSLKATGATAAEVIKDSYPQIPVVCVTKVDLKSDEITFSQRLAYDYVLNAAHLTHQYEIPVSIAEGFRRIKENPPQNHDQILDLIDCPQDDRRRLKQIMPQDVKTGFTRKGYASVLWKWVLDILFQRPGFLYDSLWAATLVGAKEKSFLKANKLLEPCKYKGIFANNVYQRWWLTNMLNLLYSNRQSSDINDVRLIGRNFLKIPPQGYSKCEISHKNLPDTVAFTDTTNSTRVQVCMEHTEEHPEFQKLLFFEEIRILKEVS